MKSNYKKLGGYIRTVDERNRDLAITNLQGVSITKEFVPSIANIIGTDLSTYKIVRTGQFAYGPVTSRNGDKVSIALLKGEDCIISSSYVPFEVYKPDELLPEYLMLWFMRPEFDRYARFMSNGSAREVFDWDCMCGVELPVPSISEQRKIVHDYQVITDRIELLRKMNETLNAMMSSEIDRMYFDVFGDMKLSEINKNQMPDGWTVKTLSEVADCQSGYAFYQDGYDESGIRVVDLGNINVAGEYILTKSDKYVSPDKCTSSRFDKYRLVQNDLVMVMTDRKSTMELLGKTGRIYDTEELMLNQRVYRIRTSPDYVSYLQSYLNSERVHLFHKSRALGTAQKYVNNGDINMIPILVPPKEEFINLCQLFNASWDIIKSNLLEIRLLDIIKTQISSLTHNTKGA